MDLKDTKVPMPRKFVDYWLENPKKWKVDVEIPCDFCDQPIKEGQNYFTTFVGSHVEEDGTVIQDLEKRGHLQHLTYAEVVPWEPPESF